MSRTRWIGVVIITVAVVGSPVVAVTGVSSNAPSPTDDPHANTADADVGEQVRSSLSGVDTSQAQASPDSSLVDVDPADLLGEGTSDDPYIITNASELQAMEDSLDAAYRLGADINASDTIGWHGGAGFDPIGEDPFVDDTGPPFTGTFNGAGYTITGLHIDRSASDQVGLFGYLGYFGQISSVTLTHVTVNGSDLVGGLVGKNDAGTVRDASASGAVTGSNGVGGLVGENDAGTVRDASASGAVTGSNGVGGLIGLNFEGTVRNAFATGTVTGSAFVGGLVGVNGEGGTVTESYWDVNTTGQPTSDGGTGLTTAQMTGDTARTNMTGLTFGSVWETQSDGYPVLKITVQSNQTTTPGGTETTAPERTETTAPGGTGSDETTSPETSTDATQAQGPNNTETVGPGQPGFGIGAAIAGLSGVGYMLKRRLTSTGNEQ